MRNIAFTLTVPQFRARTKSVTRRLGWSDLERHDTLMAVERGQGLKKGEKAVRLGEIVIDSVRAEPLQKLIDKPDYGRDEMIREGFPGLDPAEFVARFCKSHKGCKPDSIVNRIEYLYVGPPESRPEVSRTALNPAAAWPFPPRKP